MRIRLPRLVISALASAALFSGCAGGGSSVTRSADTIPSAVQHGTLSGGQASVNLQARSGVRRTMSVPTCSGTGTDAFVGGPGGNGSNGSNPNVAGGQFSVVGGGSGNQACDGWGTIAGGYNNAVSGAQNDGFIGAGAGNVVTGNDGASAIVAGLLNEVVGAEYAFIGGGSTNTLSGEYGVLVGGLNNTVSGEGAYIAAGGYNTASGEGAVVDGGFNSTAGGTFATIPGGYVNSAAGTYSFAAGARASAATEGAFVWSDGSDGDTILTSSRSYQFLARASGGFTLYTNAASTVGAQLAAGSGTWASLSDRNVKTNIVPLDDEAILGKVAALPISRWSYKSEHGVRHVGPMAQDFYAAFKVGEDDKHITSIDEDGVALAAIKALHAENAELRSQQRSLRARLGTLTALQAQQARDVARLSAVVDSLRSQR
jgi:hypothetical protein